MIYKLLWLLGATFIYLLITGCANRSTQLIQAAREGDTNKVIRLIKAGADLEARDAYGCTAFIAASSNGHWETLEALRDAGAKRTVLKD